MTLRVLRDEPLRSRTFAEDPSLRTAFPRLAYYASMWSYYEAATNTTPEDLSFVEVDGNGLPAFGFLGGSDASGVGFFEAPAIAEFADSSHGMPWDRLAETTSRSDSGRMRFGIPTAFRRATSCTPEVSTKRGAAPLCAAIELPNSGLAAADAG